MLKTKFNYNVDKLKICYYQPKGIFEEATERIQSHRGMIDFYDGFSMLILTSNTEFENDNSQVIAAILFKNPDSDEITKFATIELHNSGAFNGLCWITLENAALYRTYEVNHWAMSYVEVLGYMEEALGLGFHNITTLEIAMDTTRNVLAKTMKHIKHLSEFSMIVNGRKITDPNERFAKIMYPLCRRGAIKRPTIYFDQQKADAPHLAIYDKSDEIQNESNRKQYITEWNCFGKRTIFRAEIRIKNESFKEFWAWYCNPKNELYTETRSIISDQNGNLSISTLSPLQSLGDITFLKTLWQYFTNRLVYFRDVNNNKITLHDIAVA